MPHSPPEPSPVIDYASPPTRRRPPGRLLVWLMPLWCIAIIMAAYVLRLRDDPFWLAAAGFPVVVATGCAARRQWTLSLYSFATGVAVLAVGVLLPSVNHAT